jgi:hypothetical protein
MSFRTAYHSLKSRKPSGPQPLFRDPTPEQWKKTLDDYYIQQQKKK